MANIEPDMISAWHERAKCFDERRDALNALSTTLDRQILVMEDIVRNGQQQIRSLPAYRNILSLAGVSQPRHTFEQWAHELDIKNADEIQRDWILISVYTAVKPIEDAYHLATRAYGQMQSILKLQKPTWNSSIDPQANYDALLARLTQQRKETARIFEDDMRPLKALVDRVAGDLNNEISRLPVSEVEEFKNATPQGKSMILVRQLKRLVEPEAVEQAKERGYFESGIGRIKALSRLHLSGEIAPLHGQFEPELQKLASAFELL